jgi:hypothetical protein
MPKKDAGVTPTISYGWPSSWSVRPIADDEPPYSRCQKA